MDEKLPEWLEQCLTEDDRQLIGIVGTEAFLRLIDTYGGGNVYIPKNDRFERYARNKAIVAEFDGYNFRELAQKYHLTEMNKITGFSVLTTGEGERVTLSYSVLDADGNIVSTNNRKNYVVLDEDVLTAIATIRTDAAAHLEG